MAFDQGFQPGFASTCLQWEADSSLTRLVIHIAKFVSKHQPFGYPSQDSSYSFQRPLVTHCSRSQTCTAGLYQIGEYLEIPSPIRWNDGIKDSRMDKTSSEAVLTRSRISASTLLTPQGFLTGRIDQRRLTQLVSGCNSRQRLDSPNKGGM